MNDNDIQNIKKLEVKIFTIKQHMDVFKDDKALMKEQEKLLKELHKKLDKLRADIKRRDEKELKDKQELQKKINADKIKSFTDYIDHLAAIKCDADKVDMKLQAAFLNNKQFGPVRVALRKLFRM